jgi:hypothetical protein
MGWPSVDAKGFRGVYERRGSDRHRRSGENPHVQNVWTTIGVSQHCPLLEMHRAGLATEGRPIGVFLLLGPTGTSKTHTVETLAEVLQGTRKKYLRIDCGAAAQTGDERGVGPKRTEAYGLPRTDPAAVYLGDPKPDPPGSRVSVGLGEGEDKLVVTITAGEVPAPPSTNPHILIVDDNKDPLNFLATIVAGSDGTSLPPSRPSWG